MSTVDVDEAATETQCLVIAVDRESEAKLNSEITTLWTAHQDGKAAAKRTRAELKSLRRDLGERLHAMKNLLARTGRGGQWSAFLREHGIPRASADRHVRAHEATLSPQPVNCVTESIPEPTEAGVKQFFERLLPRLRKVLTTQQAGSTLCVTCWSNCQALTETSRNQQLRFTGLGKKAKLNERDRHRSAPCHAGRSINSSAIQSSARQYSRRKLHDAQFA